METPIFTKEILIARLKEIREMGWIPNARHGNAGGVGNTLEDLLGIEENNLPIPNAAEWEIKAQGVRERARTLPLTTLVHIEPSPRALGFVPSVLLPNFGWRHREAGQRYSEDEKSFRQTIFATGRTDRGFGIKLDYEQEKLLVTFDANAVSPQHGAWLASVSNTLDVQPYWGFQDLYLKVGSKMNNCFYAIARTKKINEINHFHYEKFLMLKSLSLEKLIQGIELGLICIDFDARTGHNHGTKFRVRPNHLGRLYEEVVEF